MLINIPVGLVFNLVCVTSLVQACCLQTNGEQEARQLATILLKQPHGLNYEQIHEVAVKDQIKFHTPIIDSYSTRVAQNLDGLYDFCLDPSERGFTEAWFNSSLYEKCPRSNFHRMPVPSAFNDILSDNLVRNHMGWVWYQRQIILPPTDSFNNLIRPSWLIHFESTNYLTIVWARKIDKSCDCNKMLVSHVGGHLPFMANLTELFDPNDTFEQSTKIVLTVAVSNMLNQETIPSGSMVNLSSIVGKSYHVFKPDFDFFHFSGLIGSVNLLRLPMTHWLHAREIGEISNHDGKKTIFFACLSGPINYWSQTTQSGNTSIVDAKFIGDQHLESIHCRPIVNSTGNDTGCFTIEIVSECLEPKQHKGTTISRRTTLSLILSGGNIELDVFEHRVAPRISPTLDSMMGLKRVVEKNKSITANKGPSQQQAPFLLKGFGMHHEQLFSGRTMSLPAIMKDLNLVRWTGANVIRTSHYPYSTAYLDACDELGISVIAECQAVGLNTFSDIKLALHKQLLLEMMERDHSHPSIIAWSVANEPQSQLAAAKPYFEKLLSYARNQLHQYTRTRPLTAAIAQAYDQDKIGHTLDFIMINHYFGWYDYPGIIDAIKNPLIQSLAGWSKLHPGKGLMISEFGADTISGMHSFSPQSEIFSEEYQKDLIFEYESVFKQLWCSNNNNNDNHTKTMNNTDIRFLGSMIWNFADFSTHNSLLRVGGNKKGVFNRDRTPKMAAHAIRSAYLNEPIC